MSTRGHPSADVVDGLLANHERWVADFTGGDIPIAPRLGLAVVACMDARLKVYDILGLRLGDAHVIRNAGGVVTDDVLRSLLLSQRLLGTNQVVLIHHTDCGLHGLDAQTLLAGVEAETGTRPPLSLGEFSDVDDSVRQSAARVHGCRYLPARDAVRGFVYDVATGRLREVAWQ